MNHDIYQMQYPQNIENILDELRKIVNKGGAGITITGNRVTIRWGNPLKHVHMAILSVEDGEVCEFCKENHIANYCEAREEAEEK